MTQPASPGSPTTTSKSTRLWGSAGYFGEFFFHPGVALGVDYRLLGNHRGALLLAGTAANYVHVRNNVGLMLYPELGGRLRLGRKRRAGLEAYGGLGYMHTFLHGTVYEVDDGGAVHEVPNRGRPALMMSGSLGVSVATKWVMPFFRAQVFGQYPFNDHVLMHAAVVLGTRVWIPVVARRPHDPSTIPPRRKR